MQMKKTKLITQLQSLFFPVEKVNAKDYAPKLNFNPGMSHLIIATDPDAGPTVVNTCSKNYHLLSNEELMAPLAERLERDYSDIEAKVKQYDFAKFYVDFVIKDTEMELLKGDKIFPRIRMNNSYDGSVKYSFDFGFYRQICTNGLMAPVEGQTKTVKFMHTPTPGGKAIDATMEAIDAFIENAPKILKGYQGMVNSKLNWAQALKEIEDVVENTKFPKKSAEKVIERLEKEKNMGLPLNNFLVYNAFNHVIYQSDGLMKEHKRDKLDATILNFINNA